MSLEIKTSSESDVSVLDEETLKSIKQRCKEDMYVFSRGVLQYSRLVKHIHMPLCRLLQDYKTNTRLKILLPRDWYKTTVCSKAYPIWRAINDPNSRGLIAQNTHTNAISKLSEIDQQFRTNQFFRALFPELMPTKGCVWTRESMTVSRPGTFSEGTFEAAGIRTQVVSRHYNYIIEDDTVAPDLDDLGEETICPTKEDIGQAIGWHKLTMPLLVSAKHDQIIVVGTRWFEKDLHSYIDENEQYYTKYTRACREDDYGQPSEKGHLTFPEEFDDEVLNQLRAAMGPYMFSCLYLNLPLRNTDMIFREDWFQYYDTLPGSDLVYYTTADPAGDPEDTKGEPDWSVVMTCAISLRTGQKYVVAYDRFKGSPGDFIDKIFDHAKMYNPAKVGIETVAAQKTYLYIIRERMKKTGKWLNIESITQSGKSKNARIMGLQPLIASANLLFRTHHKAIVSEALSFPYGKHDDLLDALAMQHGLWALTPIQAQSNEKVEPDIFTLEGVLDRVKQKQKFDQRSSRVFDLLKTSKSPTNVKIRFVNRRLVSN